MDIDYLGRHKLDGIHMNNDYIALLEMDFSWKKEEVEKVISLVNRGATIELVANKYKREPDEVFLLFLDLSRRNKINPSHNIFKLREE